MAGVKAFTNDQDAIDVLPLSIVPLRTVSLRKARIVKNSRLEGMVELFSEKESGSGQIRPHDLPSVFEFHEDNEQDLDIVKQLCGLSSYDVYSLRVLLRHEGIEVDQHEHLRLSAEAQSLLEPHMRAFTRPLVKAVYGHEDTHEKDPRGLIQLFVDPDTDQARHNLLRIAEKLAIELPELPTFLDDYCDAYLSLAYYQHYLEEIGPGLASFVETACDLRFSGLSSYDVYSLRVLLRHEGGIEVDQHEHLRLSAEAQSLLEPHMRAFTRPLVKAVYGHQSLWPG